METQKAAVNMTHSKDMMFKARVLETNANNIFNPLNKRMPMDGDVKIMRSKQQLKQLKARTRKSS